MKCLSLLFTLVFFAVLVTIHASAQTTACPNEPPNDPPSGSGPGGCDPYNTLTSGQFQATPFVDTMPDGQGHYPDYGDVHHNVVSLYGIYGNNESTSSAPATAHYAQGVTLANQIVPRCTDGTIPPPGSQCPIGDSGQKPPATVFLYIGFSNADIEIGGGNVDAWDNQDPHQHHLSGQACSTLCENLNNPDGATAWNQVTTFGGDGVTQQSLLYQIYSPLVPLVGPHVVVFNGAYGGQTLNKWDPTSIGYYSQNTNCQWDYGTSTDPECNYIRVKNDLARNGYSEAQVQAIFIKTADSFPQCDMKYLYCAPDPLIADAYQAETYMGDILRYLKCCKLNPDGSSSGVPRYPNLKQVFVTSRIYGGYGNGSINGCLNPEPFAYELGFTVQRAIVAQINQTNNITNNDQYSGQLDYTTAPWFDWAPYLWASGPNQSPGTNLLWCDSTTAQLQQCLNNPGDVRYGDPNDATYFGDHIHPTANGTQKVAHQLVLWLEGNLPTKQKYLSDWVTPWIQQ